MKNCILIFFSLLFFSGTRQSDFSESEIQINRYISEYKKEMKKKGLYLSGIGGSEKNRKCTLIDLQFDIDVVLNKEIGRELIIFYVMDFLEFLNSRPGIEKYVVEYPFTNKQIVFSLFGKQINEKDSEFLDIVKSSRGMIRYLKNVYLKPLELISEETFEEAAHVLTDSKTNNFMTPKN